MANFNEDLEPMSDFEKELRQAMEDLKSNGYTNKMENLDSNDYTNEEDAGIDLDDDFADKYMIGRLFDAQENIRDLIDFLENSDYALERGGEKFKKYIEKENKIYNEMENFWDE